VACTVAVVFRAAALGPTIVVVVVVVIVVMMVGMQLMQTVGRRVVKMVLYGVLQVVMRRRRGNGVLIRFKVQFCRFRRVFHVIVVDVSPVVLGGRVAQVRHCCGGR